MFVITSILQLLARIYHYTVSLFWSLNVLQLIHMIFKKKRRKKCETQQFFVYLPFLLPPDFEMGAGAYILKKINF